MQVTLVQCPANNPDSPPYSYALLSAALKAAGHEPHVFDLNIALYQRAKRKKPKDNAWATGHSQVSPIEYWMHEDFTRKTLKPHARFIDRYVDDLLKIPSPVIGFSVHTSSYWSSILVAQMVKAKDPSRKIIFGGPYCFVNYKGDQLLAKHDFIDMVCFLEADRTFPELLSRLERGEDPTDLGGYGFRLADGTIRNNVLDTINRKEPEGTFISDLDAIPFADWSGFDFDHYEGKYLPITTSRGCIRRCSFCSEAPIWGRYRYRSARNIADEMMFQAERHPEINVFWFMDSLVNGNLEELEELCDILIAEQTAGPDGKARGNGSFGWTGQFLVRKQMTPELWRKISLSGGQWLACGLENGSDHILRMMRKGYDRETAKSVIRDAHAADPKLISVAMFVVGHPKETPEDFEDTLDMIRFLKGLGISSSVSTCDIRRGSHLHSNLDAYDIVLPVDDEHPEGLHWAWYSKDGTNTPEHRKRLLERTMELQATMLHQMKPDEKGVVAGGINVHDVSIDDLGGEPDPQPSIIGRVSDVILRRPRRTGTGGGSDGSSAATSTDTLDR